MDNIETLKEKILNAQSQGDIASLYVLEQNASELLDEETLQGFYANILDLALERLTDLLESHRKMDFSDVQDFATTRALYEYAMEHYSAGELSDAAALFEVLSGISNDEKFSLALKIHTACAQEKMDFDDFLSNIADLDATQINQTFYISAFSKETQALLENSHTQGA
jgi:pyrroloquinoline quinone (PQQ) biosynthesis protein C